MRSRSLEDLFCCITLFLCKLTTHVIMSSATQAPQTQGVKSLQKLSAAEYLQLLQSSGNPVQEFCGLDADQQQVVFPHFWHDYQRLLKVERNFEAFRCRMPVADSRIYSSGLSKTKNEAPSARREYFASKWRYRGEEDDGHRGCDLDTGVWDQNNLVISAEPRSRLSLCPCGCRKFGKDHTQTAELRNPGVYLPGRISSQHLLYRLIATFGLPRLIEWSPTWSWAFRLVYTGDSHECYSQFWIRESLGDLSLEYEGCREGGTAAIELLNWLVGDQVWRSLGSFLAGCVARERETLGQGPGTEV